MNAIAKLAANFVETEVAGEILLVDMAGGELFAMDGTAREIWRLVDGTRDRAAIIAEMQARYPAGDAAEIAQDTITLLAELQAAGLIAC